MPLIRLPNAKVIYFAHVPKCAGTTIERYLETRFGTLGFLDRQYGAIEVADRWSLTSPQHMPEETRCRYLPDGFLDASFAIVRHPATRLRSVFLFQREVEQRIPADQEFENWLDTISDSYAKDPFTLDGHLRPMSETVPENAKIFKVEMGLSHVVAWLDQVSGKTDASIQLRSLNVLKLRLQSENRNFEPVVLTQTILDKVATIFGMDYARFQYDIVPPELEDAQ